MYKSLLYFYYCTYVIEHLLLWWEHELLGDRPPFVILFITPLQYSWLEKPMVGGAWWAAVHGVVKSRTWLSDLTFTFHFHALEKEMATHSSALAWRIQGTGGAWWAAIYGVAQSRTGLKWISSSSNLTQSNHSANTCWNSCLLIDVYFQAVPLYKILPVVLQKYTFDNVIFIVPKLLMIIQFIAPKPLMVVHNLLYRIMSTYPGRVYSTHDLYSQSHSWPLLFTYSLLKLCWLFLEHVCIFIPLQCPVSSVNRSVLFNSLWPHGLWPPRLLCPWNSPGKNTWLGCHFLLQVIFPTQGSNTCLPHCRQRL